jgi:MFS family permease
MWFTHVFVRSALPILLPLITKEFSLSYTDTGILVTTSLLVFALVQLPAGYFAGRVGSRRALLSAIGSAALFSVLLAMSTSYTQFFFFCALGAVGSGCHLTVATAFISNIFEEREIGKAIGTHESAVSLGNLLSSLAILPLALSLSWRLTYLVCATLGVVVTAAAWMFLPRGEKLQSEETPRPEQAQGIFNRSLLMLFLIFTLHAFVFHAASSFLPLYLSAEKGIQLAYLAYYVSVPHTLGIFGRPLGGHLSDKVGRRNVVLVSTASLASGIVLMVLFHGEYWLLLALVLLGFGLHTSIPPMFALLMTMIPSSKRAIIVGRVNTVRHLIAGLSPAIVGSIVDSRGFPTAFLALASIAVMGLLVTLGFREKRNLT